MSPATPIKMQQEPGNSVAVWIMLGLIVGISVAFSAFKLGQNYWDDDAFISFRYAKNLHQGAGLVYNTGERVEGYTNFLWTMIAFVGVASGAEPIHFAQFLSVVAQAGTLLLVFILGIRNTTSRYRALLAPVLLAFTAGFVMYPMTGMETSFFTMLITLAALQFCRETHESTLGSLLIGLTLAAIALTRFDGVILAFAMLGYHVVFERQARKLTPAIVLLLTILALYHGWRLFYYPTVLPNTFYAKVGFSAQQLIDGLGYIRRFIADNGLHMVLLALLALVLRGGERSVRFLGTIIAVQFAYAATVGGDWMPHFRFILPVLPLLFFLVQQGVWAVLQTAENIKQNRLLARAFAGLFLATLVGYQLLPLVQGRGFNGFSAPWFRPSDARTIGYYLDKTLPPDAVVAIEWGGILPFYMRQPVLDTFGLTDSEIVKQDFRASAFGRWTPAAYLAQREPDVIVPCGRIFDSQEEALLSAEKSPPEAPNREHSTYNYAYYAGLTKDGMGYQVCIVQLPGKKYWPVLVRTRSALPGLLCQPEGEHKS